MVIFANICYLRRGNRVLLQRKAAGLFGEGKWNGPGGKAKRGESPQDAAVREMFEETGFRVKGLRFHGLLNFYVKKELDQVVFIFSTTHASGRLVRSDEGELGWFPVDAIPYSDMWSDDPFWLPLMIEGKSFVCDFYYTRKYGRMTKHLVRSVNAK